MDTIPAEEAEVYRDMAWELISCLDPNPRSFTDMVSADLFKEFFDKFSVFLHTRCEESPTFTFWSSYVSMVESLLMFVTATREGNWNLHLSALQAMVPWLFAYDRANYARYASVQGAAKKNDPTPKM